MSNTYLIQTTTCTRGSDDHIRIGPTFHGNLHLAELFTESGRTIRGLALVWSDRKLNSNWELCPGALHGEQVFHRKHATETNDGEPSRTVSDGYCSGYHKTVWQKTGSKHTAENC